jgi:hypothetical protein
MSIIKNKKYTELFIEDEKKVSILRKAVRSWCINSGFYEDY